MLLITALCSRLSDTTLATLVKWLFSRQLLLPGPPWTFPNGQLLEKFLQGRQRSETWRLYGSVYRIWSLFTPEVVITASEDVKMFYADSRHHEKSRSSNAGWLFEQLLGEAMGLTSGIKWRRTRTRFEAFFTSNYIREHGMVFNEEAKKYIGTCFQAGHEKHITEFSMFPFLCTARLVYGPLSKEDIDELFTLNNLRMRIFGKILQGGVICFPIAKWCKWQTIKDVERFTERWCSFNIKMSQARRSSPIAGIFEGILGDKDATKQILQTLDEMLFANLDVSAHILNALVVFLAESEDARNRVLQEMQSMSDVEEYCSRRDTFLHNCLLETMRLSPISAFTMPERSPNAKSFGHIQIPPHTWVIVDILSINHNPAFWGKDNGVFRPSRFENMEQKDVGHTKTFLLKWNLFTYGFGLRQCLGQFLMDYIVKAFITQLISQYRWTSHNKSNDPVLQSSAWTLSTAPNIQFLPHS
ncbi:cytochrome P450 [Massariosphaeria phaeospora]|uniref:Cytochrome P450 n=1 Tax=Massariosphaeria phaeospora TaxID=100035 RepID=A0A7C8MIX1_9PLEO|nr:cytochrome P450 [Massariosphaeria phaeospora]